MVTIPLPDGAAATGGADGPGSRKLTMANNNAVDTTGTILFIRVCMTFSLSNFFTTEWSDSLRM
jgi:hypothetical protein